MVDQNRFHFAYVVAKMCMDYSVTAKQASFVIQTYNKIMYFIFL